MRVTYLESLDVNDYNLLRAAVGWDRLPDEQAHMGLAHSAYLISCRADNITVGAARVIWDHGYIAYLADVMVSPEYQRMGIGANMVEMAIAHMRSQLKPGWRIKLTLFSAKDKEAFYAKLGFRARPDASSGSGMDMWLE